jgi:carbon storage regulator
MTGLSRLLRKNAMDIISVTFEEPIVICIDDMIVKLIPFKTIEPGNIKFGIEAPRSVTVHREEIFRAIQLKQAECVE